MVSCVRPDLHCATNKLTDVLAGIIPTLASRLRRRRRHRLLMTKVNNLIIREICVKGCSVILPLEWMVRMKWKEWMD